MPRLPRTCVIGAGSSGLPVAKALYDRGVPFDCFDASDRAGGNWVFRNVNGMSSAYRSLHINTSRDRMQYADYPMPADFPDFPHHELIARYFEAYLDHFDLRRTIEFDTMVRSAVRENDGIWRVEIEKDWRGEGKRETRYYDALIVANGHHWKPRFPEPPFPGSFDGEIIHSHHYVDPREPLALEGKRVVVLGIGNSAMDISCELGRPEVCDQVWLSCRRGAWVIPHYLLGKPLDQLLVLPPWFPWRARVALGKQVYRLVVGRMENYGLPAPDHDLGEAHPTISSEFLPRLGRGDIGIKPNIERFDGGEVVFVDGSRERVDAVILCTGYDVSFPFFEDGFLPVKNNDLPLFKRMVRPDIPDLFFVGLMQPLGAIMPLAEAQGKWIAEHLCGQCALPSPEEMQADIDAVRAAMFARYVTSARHTMQVDFDDFLHLIGRERARGRKRARKASGLPIPPRAHRRS